MYAYFLEDTLGLKDMPTTDHLCWKVVTIASADDTSAGATQTTATASASKRKSGKAGKGKRGKTRKQRRKRNQKSKAKAKPNAPKVILVNEGDATPVGESVVSNEVEVNCRYGHISTSLSMMWGALAPQGKWLINQSTEVE